MPRSGCDIGGRWNRIINLDASAEVLVVYQTTHEYERFVHRVYIQSH